MDTETRGERSGSAGRCQRGCQWDVSTTTTEEMRGVHGIAPIPMKSSVRAVSTGEGMIGQAETSCQDTLPQIWIRGVTWH
jgi:hypothetical protein